jgi:hypothetical protein
MENDEQSSNKGTGSVPWSTIENAIKYFFFLVYFPFIPLLIAFFGDIPLYLRIFTGIFVLGGIVFLYKLRGSYIKGKVHIPHKPLTCQETRKNTSKVFKFFGIYLLLIYMVSNVLASASASGFGSRSGDGLAGVLGVVGSILCIPLLYLCRPQFPNILTKIVTYVSLLVVGFLAIIIFTIGLSR